MTPTIRKAKPQDLGFVRECADATYSPYVAQIGRSPAPLLADYQSLIAGGKTDLLIVGTAPVGFAVWYLKTNSLFLETIAILPNHQGQGLANHLFQHLENMALAHEKASLELYTNDKMLDNLTLYAHLGFDEVSRYTQDGFSRVFFKKTLR